MVDDIVKILIEEIQREINTEILETIRGDRPPPSPPPPLPNPGVLGIISEGNGKYRMRGHGTEAVRFHDRLSGLAVCTGDDWPWVYFQVNDDVSHATLISGFEQHYMGVDDD